MAEKRRARSTAAQPPDGGPSSRPRIHRKPTPETLKALSANVRALRKVADWTQDRLAERSGLGRSYVGDIERCRLNPRLSSLEAIADAFGVLIAELLEPTKGKKVTR